jgi:hypothetical protein
LMQFVAKATGFLSGFSHEFFLGSAQNFLLSGKRVAMATRDSGVDTLIMSPLVDSLVAS